MAATPRPTVAFGIPFVFRLRFWWAWPHGVPPNQKLFALEFPWWVGLREEPKWYLAWSSDRGWLFKKLYVNPNFNPDFRERLR